MELENDINSSPKNIYLKGYWYKWCWKRFNHHLFNESPFSVNKCVNTRSESLAYPNQMGFINFGHSSSYGILEKLYSLPGVLIHFYLFYSPIHRDLMSQEAMCLAEHDHTDLPVSTLWLVKSLVMRWCKLFLSTLFPCVLYSGTHDFLQQLSLDTAIDS